MHLSLNIYNRSLLKRVETLHLCALIIVTPTEEAILALFSLDFFKMSRNGLTCLFIALAPDTLVELRLAIGAAHVPIC